MVKINLVGISFNADFSSTWYKKPSFFQWEQSLNNKISVYVNEEIQTGMIDRLHYLKFAWALESPAMYSTQFIKDNIDRMLEVYELIFTHDIDLIALNPNRIKYIPAAGYWIEQPGIYEKSKTVSIITSNKAQTEGQKMRIRFIEHNQVDVFGHGFKAIQIKETGLCPYMFSVAIENGKYDDYFSEKILDCFATGTIPIYWGTNNISKYFNPEGIIFWNDFAGVDTLTPELYYSKMDAIKENFEKVLNFSMPEDKIYLYLKQYLNNANSQ